MSPLDVGQNPNDPSPRSRFEYTWHQVGSRAVLKVIDIGHETAMSVTNDIEQVLASIFTQHPEFRRLVPDPARLFILYRDSEGTWDRVELVPQGESAWRCRFLPGPRTPDALRVWGIGADGWTGEPSRLLLEEDDDDGEENAGGPLHL